MDDDRVWAFEESLWTADADHYQHSVDDHCVMVLPQPPFVYTAQQAIDAVKATPRWEKIELTDRRVTRPQEGLIAVAYKAEASRGEETYTAWCTSTYRWLAHDDWRVIQHQQTPPLTMKA